MRAARRSRPGSEGCAETVYSLLSWQIGLCMMLESCVNDDQGGPVPRPNPLQWCWHALGGKLPARFSEWVLHDATCRTWWLRYLISVLLRIAVPAAALFAVLASLGGPLWLAFLSVLLGVIVAVYYGLTYAPDAIDSRVARYGHPPHAASRIRKRAKAKKFERERRRYEMRWRGES